MSSHSLASNLLSSSAKDEYGRFVGQVIGISHNTRGDVTAIQIERGGGNIAEYPITQVTISNNSVVLIPKWKVEKNIIQKEWNLTQKKFSALDNLLKSGKVSKAVCENLRKKEFEPVIKKLREKRGVLITDLKKRHDELRFQIGKFEKSIANIELERMVAGMDYQTYKTAHNSIRPLLESAMSEERDIQAALEHLDSLDRAYRQVTIEPTHADEI